MKCLVTKLVTKGYQMPVVLDFQTVKHIKAPGRYTDALVKGLHIWVKPNGNKYWIFRFTARGKQQNMSLGSFPQVSIVNARLLAQEARVKLMSGTNPIGERSMLKNQEYASHKSQITFESFAKEVIELKRIEWSNQKHALQWEFTLKEYAYPVIGQKGLEEIGMEDVLKILTPIWQTKTETASRLRGRLEWIFAAAITKQLRLGSNPALWRGLLQTILPAPKKFQKTIHHKAMPYAAIPEFISNLREMNGVAALALEFLILNANRTSEVIDANRSEVVESIWTIPAERMKARKEHKVPLCRRSCEILAIAKCMDVSSEYLFSIRGKKLSNMAMSMILRRMQVDCTVHGFRSSFRDWVSEETTHSAETAEMALAHTIKNKVEAAYRRGALLERRRSLLNDWEFFCNSKQPKNVLPLRAA